MDPQAAGSAPSNFIKHIINDDLKNKKNQGKIVTRFPPEPNGYLHIGHAKSICLNFGIAQQYKDAVCHLRFDDTNPEKEEIKYIKAIQDDVHWLGFDWGKNLFYASDYFDRLYEFARELIRKEKAYVCQLSAEEIRLYRGTLTKPGQESPYRNRSVEENLTLFEQMKTGKFADGSHVLRAKIDMKSPNINMRDPTIYRIRKAAHPKTADKWCIYPLYDFTHCLSDALENITHSLCTLEFEDHRPLYDWFLDELATEAHPQQIEFARLNLTYTVMSKRKLLRLVSEKFVKGWDDPRLPTIAGLRRRGFTTESIRDFCEKIGVAKSNSVVDYAFLEHCIREDLNKKASRVMVVLEPLKIIITNYPEDSEELLDAENNPEEQKMGQRQIPFSRELYIEHDDFKVEAPRKFHRLSPGKEIRLKHAYYITCTDYKKDEQGKILEVYCTYDPKTKGGWSDDGRKVKGTSHWVSAKHALNIEVRLFDHLFSQPNPEEFDDFTEVLSQDSLIIKPDALAEPILKEAKPGDIYQFLRQGYFSCDPDSTDQKLVFNRTVSLRDTWAKIQKKMAAASTDKR